MRRRGSSTVRELFRLSSSRPPAPSSPVSCRGGSVSRCRGLGMNWSNRRGKPFRLALGSFIEEYNNTVEVVQLNEESQAFEPVPGGTFQHPYPTTKIMWAPESLANTAGGDLLATTGDYLRLWENQEDGTVKPKCMLNNVRAPAAVIRAIGSNPFVVLTCPPPLQHQESEFCAPLTSFDWNEVDTNLVGTSSIDTTVTIWDVNTQQVRTQLIAHDKEVYDIAFGASRGRSRSPARRTLAPPPPRAVSSSSGLVIASSLKFGFGWGRLCRREGRVRLSGCGWLRAHV